MVGKKVLAYLCHHWHEPIETDIIGEANKGSVTDKDFFETLGKLDFDASVRLAGVADIKKTIENPHMYHGINCFGAVNILELGSRRAASIEARIMGRRT